MGGEQSHMGGQTRGEGRESSFGTHGKFWEEDDEVDADNGLLKVTDEETSDFHRRLQELKARHPRSDAEVAVNMMEIRSDPWVRQVSVEKRMSELRAAHAQRLVEWETDQRRVCCQCKELIANERAQTVENPLTHEFEYCHQACHQAWVADHAPICAYEGCGCKVMPIEGRFSGSKTSTPAGIVHAECYEAWVQSMAERCALCEERLGGDGLYEVAADGKKVHAECKNRYNHGRGLLCLHCEQPFIKAPEKGATAAEKKRAERVRFEHGWTHKGQCAIAHLRETAEKCVHCQKAIMADGAGSKTDYEAGTDNISYLQLPEGKIHRKCYSAYRQNAELKCAVCGDIFTDGKFYSVSRASTPFHTAVVEGPLSAVDVSQWCVV